MKRAKTFIFVLLFSILLSMYIMPVYAEQTDFEYEPIPEEEREYFLSNIDVTLIDSLPSKSIKCFDVSEDGLIALGFAKFGEDSRIGVYSSDGSFVRGYKFSMYGSFDVGFDGDSIVIYSGRGNIATTIDADGNIENICKISHTSENYEYWNRYVSSPRRIIGGKRYYLKNDMGILNLVATSYSQLVVIDENGQSTILYDVNSQQFKKNLLNIVFFILFIVVVIISVVYTFIHTHNDWKKANS